MGFINTYNILSNASYDSNLIQILGSTFKLKLQEIDVDFTEYFENDTGFTYNFLYAEFISGLVRQKDQRPTNSIIASTFTNSLDASIGADGISLTHGINGSPSLDSGKLLCDYIVNSGQNGIYYNDSQIGVLSGNWVAKFTYIPGYTTTPPENINIFAISEISGTANQIVIFNSPSGNNLRITANGLSADTFDTWTPTSGVPYIFEIHCINNQISLYIDDQKIGATKTITPGQGTDAVRVWLGAYTGIYNVSSGSFDNFILYSTASQSSSYTIPEYAYLETNIILPLMQYIGDGFIKLFNSLSLIYGGSPKILLDIGESGNNLYWDGAAWTISDNTYSQATDLSTFNANATTLPVDGETEGRFTIVFPDSNTLSYVSELTANMKIEQYPITNPKLVFTDTFTAEALLTFLSNFTFSGNDNVTFTITKDNVERYYNSGWMVSNGTYSQSNILTEIQNNLSTFFTDTELGSYISINVFLHSENGITSPDLTDITITYDFVEIDIDSIDTTVIYGFISDYQIGSKENKTVTAILNKKQVQYKNNIIYEREFFSTTTRSNGYWELALPDTENMTEGSKYIFDINGDIYIRKVPAPTVTEGSKTFWELSN
jgi:hypothetical protein